jgi:dGTPase
VNLAGLRFPDTSPGGRRYPEPAHPYRNDFQRDRDRIVHSRAFRRLEDKTQVFGAGFSDHFRNRLTHTIEVAQVARTIAAALGLNEDLTEALALAHDIGHPPFGHSGEEELDRQMRRFGDRFNHNLHALRIVEGFEARYARFPGINLTFEVREGMVKHSRDLRPGEDREFEEYLPGLRPPLEAQLIDLADECAYNTADLDDGFAAGLFTLEEIAAAVPAYGPIMAELAARFPGEPGHILFQEALRRLIDWLVSGLIEGTREAVRAAGAASPEDVRRHPQRLVRMSPPAAATNAALKGFLHSRVYASAQLQAGRREACRAVERLFVHFLAQPETLPAAHQQRAAGLPLERVVCDYIAGMTDGFFRRTEQRLFGAA